VELQRACLAFVESQAGEFFLDFPSAGMLAVYRRIGITPTVRMMRLAKPLRVDRKVAAVVPGGALRRSVTVAGNAWLRLTDRGPARARDVVVATHEGPCGEEFSALQRALAPRCGIGVERSAAYLNWRFLANPTACYELVTARRNGALIAYAVFGEAEGDGLVMDLFGEPDGPMSALVRRVVQVLRGRDAISVSVPLVEGHPWIAPLRREGFQERETTPVIAGVSPRTGEGAEAPTVASWRLMQADRDS
jgi:hypothetical protein